MVKYKETELKEEFDRHVQKQNNNKKLLKQHITFKATQTLYC